MTIHKLISFPEVKIGKLLQNLKLGNQTLWRFVRPPYPLTNVNSSIIHYLPDWGSCATEYQMTVSAVNRSQWPRGLMRRSSAARLLRSWIRIPPVAWMFVCCECCVLSGRGLCDELITRPEESYRLWCVVVCDQENSNSRRLKPATGLWKIQP
jgi:hypothetical protein